MKSCLKVALAAVGLILIALGVAAIVAGLRVEKSAKTGIERTLSYVYGTRVTVDDVSVSFGDQMLELKGLTVYNPSEFPAGPAMQFGSIVVKPELRSLLGDTPTINEVVVRDGKVNLRYELRKGTNLGQLAATASRFAETENQDAPWGARRTFVIKELRTEAAVIDLSANVLPLANVELDVSPFTLKELSSDRPVQAAELSAVFIRSLLTEGVTLKGVLEPVGDRLQTELAGVKQWIQNRGRGDKPESLPPSEEPTDESSN